MENNNKLTGEILEVIIELTKLSELTSLGYTSDILDLSDTSPFLIQTEKIELKLWSIILKAKEFNLVDIHAELMRAYVSFIDCSPFEAENTLKELIK